MIITKLIGGNGNQMFQYAAGYSLAARYGVEYYLDIQFLLDKSKRYYRHQNRDYSLGMFSLSAKIAGPDKISKFTTPRIGNKYLYHLKKRLIKSRSVYLESTINCLDDFFGIPSDAYIDGYWQNPEYFESFSDKLREEFSFKDPPPISCQGYIEDMAASESVAVIVRRGDFVGHPDLDILDKEYYYEAIDVINRQITGIKLFFFSDDIAWCVNAFSGIKLDHVFVPQELTGHLAESYLQMISSCKHFIIPNSTFAWWGAWLSTNTGKCVIAPKKWYRNQAENVNKILPKSWLAL
jgi:hypothetical protein